jgi:hypothetical protein
MAKPDEITKILGDHERRLVKLESLIGKPTSSKKTSRPGKRVTLPQHILRLRDSGFFEQPRTANEVHKKLLPTYHCELDRVVMALFRLASRKKLRKATKTVNQRQYQAYVW